MVGRVRHRRKVPHSQRRLRQAVLLRGWSHHGQQPHGRSPRVGQDVQGPVPALQDHAGLRAALSERLRRPGPVDRGQRRKRPRHDVQDGHRGIRRRQVRRTVQGAGPTVRGRPDPAVDPAWLLDGLGQLVPHHVGREQLHHLALPEGLPREGVHLRGPRRDAVVPPMRHRHLPPRDRHRGLQGHHTPQPLRPLPADRPARRGAPHLDDDALDAHRECGCGRPSRPDIRQGQGKAARGRTAGTKRSTWSRAVWRL